MYKSLNVFLALLHLSVIKPIWKICCFNEASSSDIELVHCEAKLHSEVLGMVQASYDTYWSSLRHFTRRTQERSILPLKNCIFKEQRSLLFARKVGPLFTAFFPYRVSCPDQQGQTDPLIMETAAENESKMRPITMRAWLISLYRPLHTHWTHARSSHVHTQVIRVHKKS